MSKKKILLCFFLLCVSITQGQILEVDDPGVHTKEVMVDDLLRGSCIEVSNVAISSDQSVAKFNAANTGFPFEEGIIIRNGIAKKTEGMYTGLDADLHTQVNTNRNAYLENLYEASSGDAKAFTDIAFLEFDFVPVFDKLEFDFIFASNEYGQFECTYGDLFAFVITDLTDNTEVNIAVIPGTTTPVSATTIRDNAYNNSCSSLNPELFDTFNVTDPTNSIMNMRGYTKTLRASTDIIAHRKYRLRVIIGDVFDSQYDSAVFINTGSFETALNLWEDTEICTGDVIDLDTGFDANVYEHEWYFNNTLIPNEDKAVLSVIETGIYKVRLTRGAISCVIEDEIVLSELQVGTPDDLGLCFEQDGNYSYNLEYNNETLLGLDSSKYKIYYYDELPNSNVTVNSAINQGSIGSYSSPGDETIYIKILNKRTNKFCDAVYDFDIKVNQGFTIPPPDDILVCVDGTGSSANLTVRNRQLLSAVPPGEYAVSYYDSELDEQMNIPIGSPEGYFLPLGFENRTIFARVFDVLTPECYAVTNFNINLAEIPKVDKPEDVKACSSYTLPPLEIGSYYDEPNGSLGEGSLIPEGSVIEESGGYYVYVEATEGGCSGETYFYITIIDSFEIPVEHCGSFLVPYDENGFFYTEEGGPEGNGELLPYRAVLETNQTIFYYAALDGFFCTEKQFDLIINPVPDVQEFDDVVLCEGDTYVLQPLMDNHHFYFVNGVQRNEGYEIYSSSDVIVYSNNGFCSNDSTFQVSFVSTVTNVIGCGYYNLPDLLVGEYFTEALGGGELIPIGTLIKESQNIYVYSELANCTDDLFFTITIEPIPLVDSLANVKVCEDLVYRLPTLDNGQYFTASLGQGTELFEGELIVESQLIYIYAFGEYCSNETSFYVEVRAKPEVDSFTNIFKCSPHILSSLNNGAYYTLPEGQGEQLLAGAIIDESQTIYIYNEYEDIEGCFSESFFTVQYLNVSLGDDDFDDVYSCDFYMLPALTKGDYFTLPDGQGDIVPALTRIEETITVYPYLQETDGRSTCNDQEEILITISTTPSLPVFDDVIICGNYVLPVLDSSITLLDEAVYDVNYYREPDGKNRIEITDYNLDLVGTSTVYIRAQAKVNADCYVDTSFSLQVYPLLDLFIQEKFLCLYSDFDTVKETVRLSTNLDPKEFDVFWYLEEDLVGKGVYFDTKIEGVYRVETIKKTIDIVPYCSYNEAFVEVSTLKTVASAYVIQDFARNSIVTVEIEKGYGSYEYLLDNGVYQDSHVFQNVSSGEHTVQLRNRKGDCEPLILEVMVLKYNNFFTPNQDGYNDTWNIDDLINPRYEAVISIFNRYNRLLTKIVPTGPGWDGTFNGKAMPSSDYWFTVDYIGDNGNKKEYKANFSLKR